MHFHDNARHDDIAFRLAGGPGRWHRIVVTPQTPPVAGRALGTPAATAPADEEPDRLIGDFVGAEARYREALPCLTSVLAPPPYPQVSVYLAVQVGPLHLDGRLGAVVQDRAVYLSSSGEPL